jgi:hypothetical protein
MVEVEHRNYLLENPDFKKKKNSKRHIYSTHSILEILKDAYIIPNHPLELNRKLIKDPYNDYIVITFPIKF